MSINSHYLPRRRLSPGGTQVAPSPGDDATPAPGSDSRSATSEPLTYWRLRDQWEEMGRRIGDLKAQAKAEGRRLEEMPGASSLIEAFKALGRNLDRRTR